MKSATVFLLVLWSSLSFAAPVKCLTGFVQIEGGQLAEFKAFLAANVACLDSANYENQNYQTFSLSKGNTEAFLAALSVDGDTKQLTRIFQKDAASVSAYSYLLDHPKGHVETIKALYAAGLRKQTGPSGETFVDLAWATRAGEVVADLFIADGIKASKKERYEYIVHGALEGFTSFVVSFAEKTHLDLRKKYQYSSAQPQTLLVIALEAQTIDQPLDLEIADYYIQRGGILEGNYIDRNFLAVLVNLRDLAKESNKVKSVDEIHLKIAKAFPTAWADLIDSSGPYWGIENLLKSVLLYKTIDLNTALTAFLPFQQSPKAGIAAGWALLNAREKDFQQVRDLLLANNRFPELEQLSDLIYRKDAYTGPPLTTADAAIKIYSLGIKNKLYPLPACNVFFRKGSVTFNTQHADELISLGMDKKSCAEVIVNLPKFEPNFIEKAYYFYDISGVDQPQLLSTAMDQAIWSVETDWIEKIFSKGYSTNPKQFLSAIQRNEEIASLFANRLHQVDDKFIEEKGCEILNFTATNYSRNAIEQVLPAFLKRNASLGKNCSSLLVYAAGNLAANSVAMLIRSGADVNEPHTVEGFFAFNNDDIYQSKKKVQWTATPLVALGSYLFERSATDWNAVNSIAKQLIESGANPNLYIHLPINEFFRSDYKESFYFGLSTTAVGAAILSGDLQYLQFLIKSGGAWPLDTKVYASSDKNFSKIDFTLSLSSIQNLQYLGALSAELKIARDNYNLFKQAPPMTSRFDMLKYLVKTFGPDTGRYTIFPFRGEVMCTQHTCRQIAHPRAHMIFEEANSVSVLKWAAMRFKPTYNSMCRFYSDSNATRSLRRALQDYFAFLEKNGGNIQDFSEPTLEAIFYWRLHTEDYLKCNR